MFHDQDQGPRSSIAPGQEQMGEMIFLSTIDPCQQNVETWTFRLVRCYSIGFFGKQSFACQRPSVIHI